MGISTERAGLRSRRIDQLEARFKEPIDQLLRRLYYDEGLSQAEVAQYLKVPQGTIASWMIRLRINQRAMAEQAAKERAS